MYTKGVIILDVSKQFYEQMLIKTHKQNGLSQRQTLEMINAWRTNDKNELKPISLGYIKNRWHK